jgi:hypothetical protein
MNIAGVWHSLLSRAAPLVHTLSSLIGALTARLRTQPCRAIYLYIHNKFIARALKVHTANKRFIIATFLALLSFIVFRTAAYRKELRSLGRETNSCEDPQLAM